MVSFYGPSFMAGSRRMPACSRTWWTLSSRTLFDAEPIGVLPPNESGWTVEHMELGESRESVGCT